METGTANPRKTVAVQNPSKKYSYSLFEFLTLISTAIAPIIGIVVWIAQVESDMKVNIEHTAVELNKIETIQNERNAILTKEIDELQEDLKNK